MVELGRSWADRWPGMVIWLDYLSPSQFRELGEMLRDGLADGLWIWSTARSRLFKGFSGPKYVKDLLHNRVTKASRGFANLSQDAPALLVKKA